MAIEFEGIASQEEEVDELKEDEVVDQETGAEGGNEHEKLIYNFS